jgi:TPR repeat protein
MLPCLLVAFALAADPVADLSAKAEAGDAAAQLELSLRYRDGRGTKRDYAAALKWARLAADSGNAAAQDAVGFQFLRGLGVPQNYDVAVGYFRSAQRAGNVAGTNNLAACHFSGLGLEQNFDKAIELWKQTAAKGSPEAAARLATIYYAGDGAARDVELAEKYCRQAAEGGRVDAKLLLGEMLYQQGKKDAAKELWEPLARTGNASAKDLLTLAAWRDQKPEPGKFAYVDYRHVSQGWNNCGATSCTMLAKFQGGTATQYDIKKLCPASPPGTGTDWADLVAAAGKLGHRWKLVTFPNDDAGFEQAAAMLRAELDAGRPVGIDFTYREGGHTLTVAGYHAAEGVYILRDPAHPSPGIRIMPAKELEQLWHSRGYSRTATDRVRPAIVLLPK